MLTLVAENELIDLSDSLLNEINGIEVSGHVNVDGVVVFNNNHKILPMVSSYLHSEFRSRQISAKTASLYGKNIGYCLDYLINLKEYKGFELDEPFLTVTRATLREYFVWSRNYGLETPTIRNRDASLKAFFEKFICENDKSLRTDNPYKLGLISAGVKSKIKKGCELAEVKALMMCTKLERERLLIQFIFDTGVRRSEVGRITLADIKAANDLNNSRLYSKNKDSYIYQKGYFPIKISGSKGRNREIKERITLISASTLERVNKYHSTPLYKKAQRKYNSPHDTPAFFNAHSKPLSEFDVDNIISKTCKKAMFSGALLNRISPHNLRHGYAYEILKSPDFGQEYMDRLVNIQKTLGHSSITTTQLYTKIPIDLYKLISDENGQVLTKSKKIEKLTAETILKIKLSDKK